MRAKITVIFRFRKRWFLWRNPYNIAKNKIPKKKPQNLSMAEYMGMLWAGKPDNCSFGILLKY